MVDSKSTDFELVVVPDYFGLIAQYFLGEEGSERIGIRPNNNLLTQPTDLFLSGEHFSGSVIIDHNHPFDDAVGIAAQHPELYDDEEEKLRELLAQQPVGLAVRQSFKADPDWQPYAVIIGKNDDGSDFFAPAAERGREMAKTLDIPVREVVIDPNPQLRSDPVAALFNGELTNFRYSQGPALPEQMLRAAVHWHSQGRSPIQLGLVLERYIEWDANRKMINVEFTPEGNVAEIAQSTYYNTAEQIHTITDEGAFTHHPYKKMDDRSDVDDPPEPSSVIKAERLVLQAAWGLESSEQREAV